MPERFLNIGIQLATDESPLEAGMENWSGFLNFAHRLNLGRVIGNAEPELYANSKQGKPEEELNAKKVTDAINAAEKLLAFLHQ